MGGLFLVNIVPAVLPIGDGPAGCHKPTVDIQRPQITDGHRSAVAIPVTHRACPYDFNQPRVLRHVRVAGEPESELAPTERDERADDFQPRAANR